MGNFRTYWCVFWTECVALLLDYLRPLAVLARWLLGKK
ncbi:hypothetical protein P3T40_008207 [Paraburkholderia sp. EB58]